MKKKNENSEHHNSEKPEIIQVRQVMPNVEEAPLVQQPSNIENMETHAHHLHKAPGVRAWHYFFEFLMLFLAITLGFFVENMREEYIENKRAKEYAQSLYDDLKIDTAMIQRTSNEKVWIGAKYDSAAKILNSPDLIKYNSFIYYVGRYLTVNDIFTSQDVTYQQLRSSGSFRYIKDIALYRKISDYYNLYSRYQSVENNFDFITKDGLSALVANIFDGKDLTSFENENPSGFYDIINRPNKTLEPITTDQQNLELLYMKFADAHYGANTCILFLGWLKGQATNLMIELKREYKLE